MHTLGRHFRLGKMIRHCNCADKYILISIDDLIGFGYDLNDRIIPKMDLGLGEMGPKIKDESCSTCVAL